MKRDERLQGVTRRDVLQGIGVAIGAAALGCGGSDRTGAPAVLGPPPAMPPGPPPPTSGSTPLASPPPDACASSGSQTAEQLLAPIDTFIVLCMENRSFDHALGSLRLREGKAIEGLRGTESNPNSQGTPIASYNLDTYTPADPPHDWDSARMQWDGGAMDGFVKSHAGTFENQVMGYYIRDQLPVTYALADGSALCDRWFASVLGPTWPNRLYLHGAQAKGQTRDLPVTGFPNVFDVLDHGNLSNLNYFHDVPWCSGGYYKVRGTTAIESFFADAKAGTLPRFSIIDPHFFGTGANDDHPAHDVQLGQALISTLFSAVAQSPQWNRCLFVLTYDEHGGFFDHVAPPTVADADPKFTQLGIRVPGIVAGPFVRKGCAVGTQFDHVSVISTLTKRFGLPAMNSRVSVTNDLSSCIDPNSLGKPQPPPTLPMVTVSVSQALGLTGIVPPLAAHEPLWQAAESGQIPRARDRRAESAKVTQRLLEQGEKLGALRLID